MKRVILDTNVIMTFGEFGLDVFSALEGLDFKYKVYVLKGSLEELEKIKLEQRGKFKRFASLGLSLIKAKKVGVLSSSGDVDDALVVFSKGGDLVLTQDRGLKRRLQKPYLTIRQKRKVVVVG